MEIRTHEGDVYVFKACVVRCSNCNSSFDAVHGGIGWYYSAWARGFIECDVNGRLAIVGDVANLVANLVAN